MVVEQGPQLVAQGTVAAGVHRRDLAQGGGERRAVVEHALQHLPVGAGQRGLVLGRLAQAGFGHEGVARAGRQRLQGERLHVERGQQADRAQQQQLEGAQRGGLRRGLGARVVAGQHLHHAGVGVEQRLVRVVARQQAQQQFVDVVAREQRLAGRHDVAAHPFGAFERADLGVAAVVELQRLQRQQHGTEIGTRPLRPLGHERDAPVVAGEDFEDQARLAPVVAMEHVSRFMRNAMSGGHFIRSRRSARGPRRRPSPSAPSPTARGTPWRRPASRARRGFPCRCA
ncbi:hypothetical protein D3C86_358320 [compost metagenome]